MSQLIDTFGRVHNNLRISVTDRCNLRCTYCMPEEVVFLDKGELLTFEEITRFVQVGVGLGIDKIRLTGGEPLMRRDLPRLTAMISAIPGIRDVGYMEAFMDWRLIYRTRHDMTDLTMEIEEPEIRDLSLFTEESRNIIFLRLTKN